MKRFAVLFFSFVLCFSLTAVVASASEVGERTAFSVDIVDGVGSYENFLDGPYDVKLYRYGTLRSDLGTVRLYSGNSYTSVYPVISPPNFEIEISLSVTDDNVPVLNCRVRDIDVIYDGDDYLLTFTPVDPEPPEQSILGVFSGIGSWIASSLGDLLNLFYADGSLTIIGVLAVCGLAVSVVFTIFGIIRRFLNFG